jgi:5-methylcytosine-specific restriction endonuclease McrA
VKTCSKCGQERPLGEFHKRARSKDGLQAYCKGCCVVITEAWRKQKPEAARALDEKYRRENREATLAKHQRYRQTSQLLRRGWEANRRAGINQATPRWVDRDAIKRTYSMCPPDYHVDHIVPLKGKNVCGLHVPWNLQYLPAEENRRKGNRLIEENEHGKAA